MFKFGCMLVWAEAKKGQNHQEGEKIKLCKRIKGK